MTLLVLVAITSAIVWLNSAKGSAILDTIKNVKSKTPSSTGRGFVTLQQDDFGGDNELDDYNYQEELAEKVKFDDGGDSSAVSREYSRGSTGAREMTGRRALDTAAKNIPAINKPQ